MIYDANETWVAVACCDSCGQHLEVDALVQLVAAGWNVSPDGRVLCPACAPPDADEARKELAP